MPTEPTDLNVTLFVRDKAAADSPAPATRLIGLLEYGTFREALNAVGLELVSFKVNPDTEAK